MFIPAHHIRFSYLRLVKLEMSTVVVKSLLWLIYFVLLSRQKDGDPFGLYLSKKSVKIAFHWPCWSPNPELKVICQVSKIDGVMGPILTSSVWPRGRWSSLKLDGAGWLTLGNLSKCRRRLHPLSSPEEYYSSEWTLDKRGRRRRKWTPIPQRDNKEINFHWMHLNLKVKRDRWTTKIWCLRREFLRENVKREERELNMGAEDQYTAKIR